MNGNVDYYCAFDRKDKGCTQQNLSDDAAVGIDSFKSSIGKPSSPSSHQVGSGSLTKPTCAEDNEGHPMTPNTTAANGQGAAAFTIHAMGDIGHDETTPMPSPQKEADSLDSNGDIAGGPSQGTNELRTVLKYT